MSRLPEPGKDIGTWGIVLNDYLNQSHNADGSIKNNVVTPAALAGNIPQTKITNLQTDISSKANISDLAPVASSGVYTDLTDKPTIPDITGKLNIDQTTPQTIINGQPIQDTLTASQIVATDGSKKLQTLAVETYPSLTELSYVKGLTSGAQSQLAVITTQLGNIQNGSPKGVFATLSSLQGDTNANTTDGKKYAYVVTADGKWYYWNGTAWTAGGTYQAAALVEDDVYTLLGIPNLQPNITMVNTPLNTSFETDTNSDGLADGLSAYIFGTPSLVADAKEGAYSQKFDYINSSGSAKIIGVCGIAATNSIAAVQGDKIYVAFWVKKGAGHTATATFSMGMREANSSNVFLTNTLNSATITGSWVRYSFILTVLSATAAKVVPMFYLSCADGTVVEYFVDCSTVVNLKTSFGAGLEPAISFVDAMLLAKYPSNSYFAGTAVVPYVGYNNNKVLADVAGVIKMASLTELALPADIGTLPIPDAGNYFVTDTLNSALQSLGLLNYHSNINKFIGKKAGFLGDSITYGSITVSPYQANPIYYQTVGTKLQLASSIGEAWIGAAISREASYIDKRYTKRYLNLPIDLDIIGVFGGVNDYLENAVYGSMADTATDANNSSFYGSVKFLIEGLITRYPSGRIFFMTPLPTQTGYTTTNAVGKTLKDYVNAIREVCEYYSIPVCDLFKLSELYPYDATQRTAFIPDGLHPNQAGHNRLAEKVSCFMESL